MTLSQEYNISEKRTPVKEHHWWRRRLAVVSALAACVASLYTLTHESTESKSKCAASNLISEYELSIQASVSYNPFSGKHEAIFGNIPVSRSDTFASVIPAAINNPIVQLAVESGTVTSVTAHATLPNKAMYGSNEFGSYDHDANCGKDKDIVLSLNATQPNRPEFDIFANQYRTNLILVHEAIHGLNNEWWQKMYKTKAFDTILDPKFYELQNKCISLYRWVVAKQLGSSAVLDYFENDSIANVCSSASVAYYQDGMREVFRCVNEGNMLKEQGNLPYLPNIGHPWDNATELASSATNVLRLNPDYLIACLSSQNRLEAILIKEYVRSVLDLSFTSNPKLENTLRQNPKTAQALDFLMSA